MKSARRWSAAAAYPHDMVLPHISPLWDRKLLNGFHVRDLGKIQVLGIGELGMKLSASVENKEGPERTRATFAGVCSAGPAFNSNARSFTAPVKGTRMILLMSVSAWI